MQNKLVKIGVMMLPILVREMFRFESDWVRIADWIIKPYNVNLDYIKEDA